MRIMFFLIAATMLLSGICITSCCGDNEPPEDSYVGAYYESQGIWVGNLIDAGYSGVVAMFTDGEEVLSRSHSAFTSVAERYDSICNYYGDHGYNRVYPRGGVNNYINALHIVSVDVVCLEEYNDTHRAGSSLNDIVHITSASPYRYIKNGHKPDVDWKKRVESCSEYFKSFWYIHHISGGAAYLPAVHGLNPVDGLLDEVDPEDFPMMGVCSYSYDPGKNLIALFYFVEKMTCETCPVRFTLTLASGTEMSCDLDLKRWCTGAGAR